MAESRFNAEAAAWDQNPDVHVASKHALDAILNAYPALSQDSVNEKSLDVLEIGCGTGLLTLALAPYVRSILAVDSSTGMITALKAKLCEASAPENIVPLNIMLEDSEDQRLPPALSDAASSHVARRKFGLCISHLTLHHIPSLPNFLRTVYGCLLPGEGEILLTDFEDFGPEARKFHPEAKMNGVERDGIRKDEIEKILKTCGFENVSAQVGWKQWKAVEGTPGEWGDEGKKPAGWETGMDFPFLVIRGKRGT